MKLLKLLKGGISWVLPKRLMKCLCLLLLFHADIDFIHSDTKEKISLLWPENLLTLFGELWVLMW